MEGNLAALCIRTFDARAVDSVGEWAPSDLEALVDIVRAASDAMLRELVEHTVSDGASGVHVNIRRCSVIDNARLALRRRGAHVHVWGADYVP